MLRGTAAILSITFTAALAAVAVASAQTPPTATSRSTPLRVYLDCNDCFSQFIRNEVHFVDFVRQPQDADVQILSNRENTGGGGSEVVLRFVGRGRWAGIDQELRATSEPGAPEDERRRSILDVVTIGLLNYLARDGRTAALGVTVEGGDSPRTAPTADRWNLWVFSIGGDGSRQSEASSREWRTSLEGSADRVTDRWKMSFGVDVNERHETFNLNEGSPLEVRRHDRELDWFLARSINNHVSIGLDGDARTSTFDNMRWRVRTAPAVEVNVFPYDQYATRQLRVDYSVGVSRAAYYEVTLFGTLRDTLARQELSATLDQRQPWGTLEARVEWSQYLRDLSLTHLEFRGETSVRIARGLSFEASLRASRIRDQITLPLRGAAPEEVLLRLRELQSGHEVELSFGLRYTFGSIFNNIVNPRFGN